MTRVGITSLTLVCATAMALWAPDVRSASGDSPQVARGAVVYAETCIKCHGADGRRGEGFQTPIWGPEAKIAKFQNGQGLFEYMLFLMPFDKPDKITEDQKWDVTAYLLANHGSIQRSGSIDQATAASIVITEPAAGLPAPASTVPQPPAPAPSGSIIGSAEAGEAVFKLCRSCHEVGPNAKSKLGPALNGIVGRKAGTVEGFTYSPVNKAAGENGLTWSEVELATFLADPRKFMPGNRMAFAGVKDAQDRADLIAYLKTFKK